MESHFVFCHSFGGRKRSWKNPTYYNTYFVIYYIYIYGLFLLFWSFSELVLKSLLLCCYFDPCRAFNWHCRRTHAPLVHLKSFILCPFLFGMFQATSEKSILNQYVLLFLLFHMVRNHIYNSSWLVFRGWLRATCIQLLQPWELDGQARIYLRELSMEQPKAIWNI